MAQPHFDRHRDEQVAAEVNVDRSLMCPAAGCPNRWSVSGERGKGCSSHYWANPRDWPRITQELVEAETDRARWAAAAKPERPEARPGDLGPVRKAAVAALQAFVDNRASDSRAWARELHRRHLAGERLAPSTVATYRGVLRLEGEA